MFHVSIKDLGAKQEPDSCTPIKYLKFQTDDGTPEKLTALIHYSTCSFVIILTITAKLQPK